MAGLPPVTADAEPGILDAAGDERRTVAELAAEMSPADVGELLAPLVAPLPYDLTLAREHVLEHADPVRRAEIESVAGARHDLALQVTPTDFDLAAVSCPVRLWYRSAPPAFGRWFATHLPDATLEVVDGAGHCLILPRWAEILRSVL